MKMRHKYLPEDMERMRELYLNGCGQRTIGRILQVPWQSVWPFIRHIPKEDRKRLPVTGVTLPIPKHAQNMSDAKARILGYIMAEGCLVVFKKKHLRQNKWSVHKYCCAGNQIAFYNEDTAVINRFILDFNEVYGITLKYNVNRMETRCYRKEVFHDLNKYGPYGSLLWRIPEEIINGKTSFKKEWLKAFCDGESYVEDRPPHKRIVIYSNNKEGLLQIQRILTRFDVSNYLNGPYGGTYRLRISGQNNILAFHRNIGFYHSKRH
jgi:hypothetical protein